jgi:hypothetical protein
MLIAQALVTSRVYNMPEGVLPKDMRGRILQVFADALVVPLASDCLGLRNTLKTG